MTNSDLPWWWPERTDSVWCQRVRRDYPEKAHYSDEELRDYFAEGGDFAWTWDHTGDAREQVEPMADFLLKHFPNGPPTRMETSDERAND